jgi:hypothetical protein
MKGLEQLFGRGFGHGADSAEGVLRMMVATVGLGGRFESPVGWLMAGG